MKLQELNQNEMTQINGGGLFGSNDSQSSNSLTGSIGIGSLLSFSTETQDGDERSKSSFSVGNGIGLDLGGLFNNLQS
ncbi:hypothetical protein [Pedobacter metabolipauper]|uniref:Bacteriocin-like protein n=1 Tax=Pedobacter metabolipauper TaxID=425513 RepID=A0A4R6SW38_9SPHI|nr:hypothetical protein [Pedobacter metabolipauper]TDQ09303.1 bacteriocin-like protein [Pedobacter metabolipauper]